MNAASDSLPSGEASSLILVIDTAGPACQSALCADGRLLAERSQRMVRGHGEALIPMIEALLADAGRTYDDLDRIGVTVGPGSFTGMRVGLAAARGFSATLGIPAVGIGSLEALALADALESRVEAPRWVGLDARNGLIYGQRFDAKGRPTEEPHVSADLVFAASVVKGARLVGPVTPVIAALARAAGKSVTLGRTADVPSLAALAQLAASASIDVQPRPLYLKAAEAIAARPAGLRTGPGAPGA